MTVDSRQIIDEYLAALETELRDLAPSDRADIILEVREHYEEARRELPDLTEAALRNIVERLGPPPEIAAEARQRLGVTVRTSVTDSLPAPSTPFPTPSAAGPLEVAALIGWMVWWPAGVMLMAISTRWTKRVKATAMVVELGFLALVLGYFSTPTYFNHSSGSHNWILPLFLLFPPTLPGIVGAVYLTWKLVAPGHRHWSATWKVAGRTAGIVIGAWLIWVLILAEAGLREVRDLASAGTLSPWNREPVPAEVGNDLWCRPGGSFAWALQLNLLDSQGGRWLFRRNRQITLPISRLGRQSKIDVPYLAPQIVLLFKAKNPRPRDVEDFDSLLPLLDRRAKEWLATSIGATYGDHPWRERLLAKALKRVAEDQ